MSTTEEIIRCGAAFLGALIVTLASTPYLRRLALRYDVIDAPAEHKAHTTPTPYLGGIGLIAALLLGIGVAPAVPGRMFLIVLGGLAVGVVGLIDDKLTLGLAPRVAVQAAAAMLAVAAGPRAHVVGNSAVDIVITVVWIVGITNALNLLDNQDGLCAGATAITAIGALVIGAYFKQYLIATAAASLIGGCLGFLAYNKRPAKIFMGDAGALVLGYAMAVVAIAIGPGLDPPDGWLLSVMLLWLPILDTGFVIVTRLAERRPVLKGGKDHLSHRLTERGVSPGVAVLVLLGLHAVVIAVTLVRFFDYAPGGTEVLTAVLLGVVLIEAVIRRPSPAALEHAASRKPVAVS